MLLSFLSSLAVLASVNAGRPCGKGLCTEDSIRKNVPPATTPITYQAFGAPVLTGSVKMHFIFYGSFLESTKSIVTQFAKDLPSSPWYAPIKKYYYQASATSPKVHVSGSIAFSKAYYDTGYSQGKALVGAAAIERIIQNQINIANIPEDTHNVFHVFLASDVTHKQTTVDGTTMSLCTDYCAYHESFLSSKGTRLAYAAVADPNACPLDCIPEVNRLSSPNGNVGADAMVNTAASELMEMITNPHPSIQNAWINSNGYELGDMCEWAFGQITLVNGNAYNSLSVDQSGERKYLLQQILDRDTNLCGTIPFNAVNSLTGKFLIRASFKSNRCLDCNKEAFQYSPVPPRGAPYWPQPPGRSLLLSCNSMSSTQVWTYDSTTKQIRLASNPNLCLDDGGATPTNPQEMVIYPCNSASKNQKWIYDPIGKMISNPAKSIFRWGSPSSTVCIDDAGTNSDYQTVTHQVCQGQDPFVMCSRSTNRCKCVKQAFNLRAIAWQCTPSQSSNPNQFFTPWFV